MNRGILEQNFPFPRMNKTRNGLDYRGFTGAVRTDEADYLSFIDPESNVLNSQDSFISRRNVI